MPLIGQRGTTQDDLRERILHENQKRDLKQQQQQQKHGNSDCVFLSWVKETRKNASKPLVWSNNKMQVILCLVVDENNPDGARKSDLQGVGPEWSKLMLQSQSLSSEFSFPNDDDEEEKEEEDNDDDDDKLLPGWF